MAKEIQHPTLGERTYQEMKSLILSGRYKPGERLLYQQLVKQLGVSQTPIKEAFTRLENEGFVVTITRKGTFVRDFSTKEIQEFFQIREMLEALAVRLACRTRDPSGLERLRSSIQRFKKAASRGDVNACTKEDYYFHETLIGMAGNGKLAEIMSKNNLHLFSIVQSSPRFLEIADEYHKMHARIIAAIEAGDEDLAERLMREHIRHGHDEVLPYVEPLDLGDQRLG